LGYSYAREAEVPQRNEEEIIKNYNIPAEAKLRPLINYDHQPDLINTDSEKNVLRDIG
jgi:hypothetical protein